MYTVYIYTHIHDTSICIYIYIHDIHIYKYISLYIIVYHCISFYIIVYYCTSLYIIVYHCISLYIIVYQHICIYSTELNSCVFLNCFFCNGFRGFCRPAVPRTFSSLLHEKNRPRRRKRKNLRTGAVDGTKLGPETRKFGHFYGVNPF